MVLNLTQPNPLQLYVLSNLLELIISQNRKNALRKKNAGLLLLGHMKMFLTRVSEHVSCFTKSHKTGR